ncbi:MAG TPA: hypothetical protein VNZ22_02445 [Bacillota bacterium]|nr:hypothetical protein [Bacillota bacterium]
MSDKPRPNMLVPAGLQNLATKARVSSSDTNAQTEALAKIIDGDKEPREESIIFLRKGLQYVQMDLGAEREIFAVVLWHAHNTGKVYRDVIVQASTAPEFTRDVVTLYNNDQDNTAGLGLGTDKEYFETREGRLVNAKGVKARYLRFYSRGSTESSLNEYTEVEAYGR